jgi:hypothetical protein
MIFYLLCDRCHGRASKIVALDSLHLDASLCAACYAQTVSPEAGSQTVAPSTMGSVVTASGEVRWSPRG